MIIPTPSLRCSSSERATADFARTRCPSSSTEPPPLGGGSAGCFVLGHWASVVGLAGLVIVFGITQPIFLSTANLQALLLAAAILVVIAIGQTFVVATSGIDLSLAATIMFGAIVLGCVYSAGWGILAACVLAIAVTSLIGFFNGVIITLGRIPDFVVTLGTLSAITGLGLILSAASRRWYPALSSCDWHRGHLDLSAIRFGRHRDRYRGAYRALSYPFWRASFGGRRPSRERSDRSAFAPTGSRSLPIRFPDSAPVSQRSFWWRASIG